MQQEVLYLPASWKAHMNVVQYTGDWNVLSLRSPGGITDNIVPEILDTETITFKDTPLMEQCPAIQKLVASLNCEVYAVRLMNLKKGATIKPHRDKELCFENGEARLHIPIFTNDQVAFYSQNNLIPMREGECWYINANITHSVQNNGTSDRIHLVIDCAVNDAIEALFAQADKTEEAEELDVNQTLEVIKALRQMNTAISLDLAASLEARLQIEA